MCVISALKTRVTRRLYSRADIQGQLYHLYICTVTMVSRKSCSLIFHCKTLLNGAIYRIAEVRLTVVILAPNGPVTRTWYSWPDVQGQLGHFDLCIYHG